LLQAFPFATPILVGRGLYGWGLFQATVGLDARLFALSTPDAYATDFSVASVFQSFGVAASSLAAGSLVGKYGSAAPFLTAAVALLLTALLLPLLVYSRTRAASPAAPVQGRA
jgi:predicted MFS family arabinose efflux permease